MYFTSLRASNSTGPNRSLTRLVTRANRDLCKLCSTYQLIILRSMLFVLSQDGQVNNSHKASRTSSWGNYPFTTLSNVSKTFESSMAVCKGKVRYYRCENKKRLAFIFREQAFKRSCRIIAQIREPTEAPKELFRIDDGL